MKPALSGLKLIFVVKYNARKGRTIVPVRFIKVPPAIIHISLGSFFKPFQGFIISILSDPN
jgi:hypothetical protein